MSSERFEYAEDELEGVLERLGSALTQLGNKSCQSLNNVKIGVLNSNPPSSNLFLK